MKVRAVTNADIPQWLDLAREVEPLFGPMVADEGFRQAMREAIAEERAFGVDWGGKLAGCIVLSPADNEIAWLAVAAGSRRHGLGRLLLAFALERLDPARPVTVQTFESAVAAGAAARRLYAASGFVEVAGAGPNPAGVPTVIMRR